MAVDYETAALQLALAQGETNSLNQLKSAIAAVQVAFAQAQAQAATDLSTAQTNLGAATPVTVGILSVIDTRSQTERAAGKAAAVAYIKANPTCAEADAITAWNTGAQPTIPAGCTLFLNNPNGLLEAYMTNAHALGATPDTTWASFAAFIIATPTATLMAM